jgi:hypothetical protein
VNSKVNCIILSISLKMSVRPVSIKEIRKTAVVNHQLQTGTGNYNRWSPLVPRDRSVSVGKRRLSDKTEGCTGAGSAPKAPRFDSTLVLTQLKGQETTLAEVKDMLGKMDYEKVLGQVLPLPVKDVIINMCKALDLLLASQEKLTSVLVDAVKVSEVKTAQSSLQSDTNSKVKTPPAG